jgi:hypothetical protein
MRTIKAVQIDVEHSVELPLVPEPILECEA